MVFLSSLDSRQRRHNLFRPRRPVILLAVAALAFTLFVYSRWSIAVTPVADSNRESSIPMQKGLPRTRVGANVTTSNATRVGNAKSVDSAKPVSTSSSKKSAPQSSASNPSKGPLWAMKFEVFGRVQGVNFRAYTKRKGVALKLVGYVQNTKRATVIGEAQGSLPQIEKLEEWMRTTGSPSSRIDKLSIIEKKEIPATSYTSFKQIRKWDAE